MLAIAAKHYPHEEPTPEVIGQALWLHKTELENFENCITNAINKAFKG